MTIYWAQQLKDFFKIRHPLNFKNFNTEHEKEMKRTANKLGQMSTFEHQVEIVSTKWICGMSISVLSDDGSLPDNSSDIFIKSIESKLTWSI